MPTIIIIKPFPSVACIQNQKSVNYYHIISLFSCAQRVIFSSHKFFLLFSIPCSRRNEIFVKLNLTGAEQQETSNKLHEDENKTGIKTEAIDIKEETKLMTVEDVSEKLGTLTRYMQVAVALSRRFCLV